MALAYSSTVQAQLSRLLFGTAYANLNATDKDLLDGTWTTGEPGGAALRALTSVRRLAQWVEMGGSTTAPDEFERWWVAETIYVLGPHLYPDRAKAYQVQRDEAMTLAIESFGKIELTATSTEGYLLTMQNLRYSVVRRTVRRKDRLIPQVEEIDSAIKDTLMNLWNRAMWSFALIQTTMDIAETTGTVTFPDLSGVSFEYTVSRKWYYEVPPASNETYLYTPPSSLVWASADQMAIARAAQLEEGRPALFRVLESSGTKTYLFDRAPDQNYTLHGEVFLKTPTLATSAGVDAALARFPAEFHEIIRNGVLGRVLMQYGDATGPVLLARNEDEINRIAPVYDSQGLMDEEQTVADEYADDWQRGTPGRLGGPM